MNSQSDLLDKFTEIQFNADIQVTCIRKNFFRKKCGAVLMPTPIEQGQDDPEICFYCEKCKETYLLTNEYIENILRIYWENIPSMKYKIGEK